jgi:HSP20 family protein
MDRNDLACCEPHTPSARDRLFAGPAVDIYENDQSYLVVADVPGANAEGLDLRLDKGILALQVPRPAERGRRVYGPAVAGWRRVFRMPEDIDADAITAELKDGVLRVTLPRKAQHRPRQVRVSVG